MLDLALCCVVAILLGTVDFRQRFSEVWLKKWPLFSAFAFLLWIANIQLIALLGLPLPSPGKAFVLLSIAAGIMGTHPNMPWSHKIVWITILASLGVMEFQSIDQDRLAHEKEFSSIVDGVQAVIRASDRNFKETMHGIQDTLEATKVTLENTAPSAILVLGVPEIKLLGGSCALDPCKLLEMKAGEEATFTLKFHNKGSRDAESVLGAAQMFVGIPKDLKFQADAVRDFEVNWTTVPNFALHVPGSVMADPEIHTFKIHPLFQPRDINLLHAGGTVYLLSRLQYQDSNGRWEEDKCEYLKDIRESPLSTTLPCGIYNTSRKRIR